MHPVGPPTGCFFARCAYVKISRSAALTCLAVLCLLSTPGLAAQDYLSELVAKARALRLWQTQEWRDLGHYKRTLTGGYSSLADSANFFLSPQGKDNPQAELEATLAAFFDDTKETDRVQNPQCAFIARYHWLDERLHFDPRRLPARECRRFDDWYAAINPGQATLVFPAAYLNNPSSMFGHTLLRFDPPGQSENTRLASYAINYAAQTRETNGLLFAVRGLTGGYPGQFSIMPYYEKVREYSDLENRDIWEYQLNLTRPEMRRLLEHAWELGPVRFDYYFFDENCSYMLLELLDVARPGMHLANRFHVDAIPSDTVRAVLTEEGMLRKVVFRPANRTQIVNRLHYLGEAEQRLAKELADGDIEVGAPAVSALAPARRAQVLDVAYRYLQYRYHEDEVPRSAMAPRSLRLLAARSRIDATPQVPRLAAPPVRPDQGHGTARAAAGVGRWRGEDVLALRFRPAYHDLLDASGGYTPGAQINFLDVQLRYLRAEQRLRLESFDLIDIISLTPRDAFFQPVSWQVRTGFERLPIAGRPDRLAYTLEAGGGLSYRPLRELLVFGLLQGQLLVNGELDDDYAFGAGPLLGLLWDVTPRWKLWLSASRRDFEPRTELTYVDYRLEQSYALSRNRALRLKLERKGALGDQGSEALLSLHWYF